MRILTLLLVAVACAAVSANTFIKDEEFATVEGKAHCGIRRGRETTKLIWVLFFVFFVFFVLYNQREKWSWIKP